MEYFNLTNEQDAKLKSQNFRRDSPSQFLIYDSIMESPYTCVAGAAQTVTLNLSVNNCVTSTHVLPICNTAGCLSALPADSSSPGYIDAVGFKLMSKYIYQSICTLGMQLQRNVWGATDMCYGASSSVGAYGYVPVSLRLNQPISTFWGLDNSHSYNSGAVSTKYWAEKYFFARLTF